MRRHRCSKHPDMLVEGQCPRCEVERLTELNERLEKAAGIYGAKASVVVSYRWRDVLGKLLHLLAVPRDTWNDPTVRIGSGASREGGEIALPKALAEKIAEIAKEFDEEYVEALLRGYDDGVQVVAAAFSEVAERLLRHRIKTKGEDLRKRFAKDRSYRTEYSIMTDAVEKELLSVFDEDEEDEEG